MKKNLKIFLLGGVVGILIFICMQFVPSWQINPFWENILAIISFPGQILRPVEVFILRMVDSILNWLCAAFQSDMCRGLGFDGGPLEWVEWTSIVIPMAVWYGLIFLLIKKLIDFFIKQRKIMN